MTYLTPEIVASYYSPSLLDGAAGFTSAAGNVDGDGSFNSGGDDA